MVNESDIEPEAILDLLSTLFVELYGISEDCIELSAKLDRELKLPLELEAVPEVVSKSVAEF